MIDLKSFNLRAIWIKVLGRVEILILINEVFGAWGVASFDAIQAFPLQSNIHNFNHKQLCSLLEAHDSPLANLVQIKALLQNITHPKSTFTIFFREGSIVTYDKMIILRFQKGFRYFLAVHGSFILLNVGINFANFLSMSD